MFQTIATLGSVLLSTGAFGVILHSLIEERVALRAALHGVRLTKMPLPAHTYRVAGPRPARFIRMPEQAAVRRHVAA